MPDGSTELSETDVFALLARERRQLLLQILRDFPTPLRAEELAEILARCEYDDPTDEHVRIVHLSLYHAHLPKLADADVVAYDRETGIVDRGANFETLLELFRSQWDESDSFVASS